MNTAKHDKETKYWEVKQMIRRPNEDDINETKELWQWVGFWRAELGFTPETLAPLVRFSPDSIKKGLRGEYVPIRHALLNFDIAFGLISGRDYVKTDDSLSYAVLKNLLNPKSRQRKLFKESSEDTLVDWGC